MWKSIWQILDDLKQEEYVFLRNAQGIKEDFNPNDDWDILCSDMQRITRCLKAIPLNNKDRCFNYYTLVKGKRLLIDIRCIGDGYYDAQWEKEMIEQRVNNGYCYVLGAIHQRYSMLYHCLIHKDNFSVQKYKDYILSNFGIYDLEQNLLQLSLYMKQKKYACELPEDQGVYLNYENKERLKELL